jgi:hypothetical protein
MSDSNVFQLALARWRNRHVPLLPPASDAEIAAAFAVLEYPLSDDVRALYRLTAGFENDESDDCWSLWPLSHVVEQNKQRKTPFPWFADWMIDSHRYCLHYRNPGLSAVYIDHNNERYPPYLIAESVGEFFDELLRNRLEVEALDLEDP